MAEPQPIDTAPKDGTAILTNCGFVRWHARLKFWIACDPEGDAYECVDEGYWRCDPKRWTPVPSWILE